MGFPVNIASELRAEGRLGTGREEGEEHFMGSITAALGWRGHSALGKKQKQKNIVLAHSATQLRSQDTFKSPSFGLPEYELSGKDNIYFKFFIFLVSPHVCYCFVSVTLGFKAFEISNNWE